MATQTQHDKLDRIARNAVGGWLTRHVHVDLAMSIAEKEDLVQMVRAYLVQTDYRADRRGYARARRRR